MSDQDNSPSTTARRKWRESKLHRSSFACECLHQLVMTLWRVYHVLIDFSAHKTDRTSPSTLHRTSYCNTIASLRRPPHGDRDTGPRPSLPGTPATVAWFDWLSLAAGPHLEHSSSGMSFSADIYLGMPLTRTRTTTPRRMIGEMPDKLDQQRHQPSVSSLTRQDRATSHVAALGAITTVYWKKITCCYLPIMPTTRQSGENYM